jgi:saccharopine dehydrogenase-like NADP-dependent oxidoreductase
MIMKAIDDIHQRGGQVTEVVSLCGGLPDPAAADNPMRYKISWSPLGMLRSAKSAARYMKDGEVIIVNGDKLLTAACPSFRFPTMRLEAIPNRDSLMYRDVYDIPSVRTLCRGTLRYEGKESRVPPRQDTHITSYF